MNELGLEVPFSSIDEIGTLPAAPSNFDTDSTPLEKYGVSVNLLDTSIILGLILHCAFNYYIYPCSQYITAEFTPEVTAWRLRNHRHRYLGAGARIRCHQSLMTLVLSSDPYERSIGT